MVRRFDFVLINSKIYMTYTFKMIGYKLLDERIEIFGDEIK